MKYTSLRGIPSHFGAGAVVEAVQEKSGDWKITSQNGEAWISNKRFLAEFKELTDGQGDKGGSEGVEEERADTVSSSSRSKTNEESA